MADESLVGDIQNYVVDKFKQLVNSETARNAAFVTRDAINSITAEETQEQRGKNVKEQKLYQYKYHQYPLDLAKGGRHPYYMTFFIATQDLSQFKRPKSKGPAPLSTVDINARATKTLAKNYKDSNIGFGRKTHRTTNAIRLYMPDSLSWNFRNQFGDVSLSGIPGTALAQAIASGPALANSLIEGYQKSGITGLLASLNSKEARAAAAPLAEVIGDKIPGVGSGLLTSALGVAVNPQIDVIYQSPSLREFIFDYLFAPRNAQESAMVSDIIKLFKFHASPEILSTGFGRYFIPPSEFDIEFSVNTMGKISTCVLEEVTVDYAPSGASFYRSDDQPVNTHMTLRFKELEFMTKELIERGY
jgi:hypothetical protein